MDQLELARAFRSGELPLTNYISQIETFFEECEPSILAFIPEENRFERLRKDAQELIWRFPDPKNRPPLFGMTVGVKDIFHVDGFTTQAGSRLPAHELQGNEAESVTRLKNAGALILGKTVTTEFAYFTPGPTRNPHDPAHTPGGSSSGSAAAVGAGLCPLALGTQTIGSLIRPAAFCGTVTLKPTYDRISRSGVIPLSPSSITSDFSRRIFPLRSKLHLPSITIGIAQSLWMENRLSASPKDRTLPALQTTLYPASKKFANPYLTRDTNCAVSALWMIIPKSVRDTMPLCHLMPRMFTKNGSKNTRIFTHPNLPTSSSEVN